MTRLFVRLCAVGALALQLLIAPSPSLAQSAPYVPGAEPRAAQKSTLTPEELANPALATSRGDKLVRPEVDAPSDHVWPPGSVPTTAQELPMPLEPAPPRTEVGRRADKLAVRPVPPPPPPDPATERLDLIFVILFLIVFCIGSVAWRIHLWRAIPNSWAKRWLSPG